MTALAKATIADAFIIGPSTHAMINNQTITLTPSETPELGLVWRCGTASQPPGLSPMGTSGSGAAAAYIAPSVPDQYLSSSCRQ